MIAVLKSLQKTVTAAGTAEALSATKVMAYGLKIKALPSNTQNVAIGSSGVLMATGYVLDASEELALPLAIAEPLKGAPIDISKVYVDADVNGEGVCVSYFEENLG